MQEDLGFNLQSPILPLYLLISPLCCPHAWLIIFGLHFLNRPESLCVFSLPSMELKHVLTTSSDLAASPLGSPHCPHGRVQHFQSEAAGTPLELPLASSTSLSPASLSSCRKLQESADNSTTTGSYAKRKWETGKVCWLRGWHGGQGEAEHIEDSENAISGDREQLWLSPLAGPDGYFPKTSL